MKKCKNVYCSKFELYEDNGCTSYHDVSECGKVKDNIFLLEWIPVTDEKKPGNYESVALLIKIDSAKFFRDGMYIDKIKELDAVCFCYYDVENGAFTSEGITQWARITLPGESE